MADQDIDGSHIKGLVMNFFHKYWPELLKRPGFLRVVLLSILDIHNSLNKSKF